MEYMAKIYELNKDERLLESIKSTFIILLMKKSNYSIMIILMINY